MARIFLSHSSANDVEAVALRDWLTAEGWDDLFLDLDPTRGIAAGERWERRLHEAANRCEAVLFLISRAWLDSPWCRKEFNLAQKLNKRTFCVLVEDLPVDGLPAELTATWQLVNLAAGSDHQMVRVTLPDGREAHVTYSRAGLARLKTGLTRAGLDARTFAWPPEDEPDRPPFRGLKPLEAEDAGIFYGREAPTIEALDKLRGLAEAAPPRFLAILAASGAGKSSFLRAGLVPRLKRDGRDFLMLPIVRPERSALTGETGLLRALEEAGRELGLRHSRADIRAALADAAAFGALIDDLIHAAGAPDADDAADRAPRAVLAIDQAEELFLAEGGEEAGAFLKLIGALASAPDSNLIVIFTIRSDSFERLQTVPELPGLQPFSLPPMPRGAYQTVIEGPAKRLADTPRALAIEPALTGALLADIEDGGGKDALPLLAFTLERLYLEYGGNGTLTLAEYRELGGISGSIEAAVEGALHAADGDPAVPEERAARLALLRRALIPWLAGIDTETGQPRRRVARLSEIPEEARPLVEHLIAARLLATDVSPETGERTIEPAHEALLRQWSLLQGWLEEDFAALATLEGIRRAARDWAANDKDEAWLSHSAGRLEDAEAVARRADFAGLIEATDHAYLDAARAIDTARRNRELEEARKLAEAERQAAARQRLVAQRTRIGLVVASLLALVAIGLGIYGFQQANLATAKGEEARKSTARLSVSVASGLIDQGATSEAAVLLLNAAQSYDKDTASDEMLIAFHKLNEAMARKTVYDLPPATLGIDGPDALYFIDNANGDILRFDGTAPPAIVYDGDAKAAPIDQLSVSPDARTLFVLRRDRTVERIAVGGDAIIAGHLPEPEARQDRMYTQKIIIEPDGMVVDIQTYFTTTDATNGAAGYIIHLLDAVSGQSYSGTGRDDDLKYRFEYLTDGSDRRYLYPGFGAQAVHIGPGDKTLSVQQVDLPAADLSDLRTRTCFLAGQTAIPAQLPKLDFAEKTDDHRCSTYGDSVVHSYNTWTIPIVFQVDIVDPTGASKNLKTIISRVTHDLVRLAPSWAGADAELGEYAALVNRDLLVFTDDTLDLVQKHVSDPGPARFLGNGRLAVAEPGTNQVIVYDLTHNGLRDTITHDGAADVIAHKTKFVPLNKGTCVGGIKRLDNAIDYRATLPDGAALTLTPSGTPFLGGDRLAITLSAGGKPQTIFAESETSIGKCLQFSADWTRMLLYDTDSFDTDVSVGIYDVAKIRATGTLDGAKVDELPPRQYTSAFPVGPGPDIITTDTSHAVLRWHKDPESGAWSSRQIYTGDNPVTYAEPDATGDRLLITENLGAKVSIGFLYSVSAHQRWFELGTDTQYDEAFSSDLGIVAGAGKPQLYVRQPSFDELVSETADRLPASCRPAAAGAYDTSRCWPAWLRGQ